MASGGGETADTEAETVTLGGLTMIDEDPGPKLDDYSELVLARSRTRDLDMFRLADSPSMLLVHDRVLRALAAQAPPEGWGFTAIEIGRFKSASIVQCLEPRPWAWPSRAVDSLRPRQRFRRRRDGTRSTVVWSV